MIHMGDEYHLWWLTLGESNRLLAKDTDCWHSMNNANTHGWWPSLGEDTHWVMTTMDGKDHWSLIIDHWSSQTEDYHGWWWLVMVLVIVLAMVVDSHWCHSLGDGIHPLMTLTGEWFWSSHDNHPLSTAIPMARDEHLMRMGVNWWRSPDEDDCLIHWMMILTEWWSSPSDSYLWQLSSSDRDHWLMTPIEWWLSR